MTPPSPDCNASPKGTSWERGQSEQFPSTSIVRSSANPLREAHFSRRLAICGWPFASLWQSSALHHAISADRGYAPPKRGRMVHGGNVSGAESTDRKGVLWAGMPSHLPRISSGRGQRGLLPTTVEVSEGAFGPNPALIAPHTLSFAQNSYHSNPRSERNWTPSSRPYENLEERAS